jgi:ribosome modulation factor
MRFHDIWPRILRSLEPLWKPRILKYEGTPAFNAGRRASDAGVSRSKNPHREGSPEREAWFEGWLEQRRDDLSEW